MKKVIPEQIDIYCDRCGNCCTDSNCKAQLVIRRKELNFMGEWQDVPNEIFDLCDLCFELFNKFMDNK